VEGRLHFVSFSLFSFFPPTTSYLLHPVSFPSSSSSSVCDFILTLPCSIVNMMYVESPLRVIIMRRKSFLGTEEPLGLCKVFLSSLEDEDAHDGWFEMRSLDAASSSYAGTVRLKLHFTYTQKVRRKPHFSSYSSSPLSPSLLHRFSLPSSSFPF
jgi:hypothetical protein